MKKEQRQRLAKAFGKKLLRARAKRGDSVQKLYNLMKAKEIENPPEPRTIQRHEDGDMYPWKATREMYALVYPEMAE